MGQWREIAAGADRALAWHHGEQVMAEKVQQALHDGPAHARVASAQAGRLEQQHQSHHGCRHRLAHAHRVRTQQVDLQLGMIAFRDAGAGQLAKAGVQAVDHLSTGQDFSHRLGAGQHRGPGRRCEVQRLVAVANFAQLFPAQLAGGDRYHGDSNGVAVLAGLRSASMRSAKALRSRVAPVSSSKPMCGVRLFFMPWCTASRM